MKLKKDIYSAGIALENKAIYIYDAIIKLKRYLNSQDLQKHKYVIDIFLQTNYSDELNLYKIINYDENISSFIESFYKNYHTTIS